MFPRSGPMDGTATLLVEDCNCVSLRKASRRISLYYDTCLAPAGLRATQFSILAVMAGKEALSVNALASALDMDRSTAGQNLKVLQREGLMEIVRDPADGRSRLMRLTPAGQEKLARAMPLWQSAQREFERLNGKGEAATMRAMLKGIELPAAR